MKKWFHRIVMGLFLAVVLLYGFVMLRSLIPATVNDRELRLERADIPEGSNAFDVLQEAGRHVWEPENSWERLGGMMSDTNWDADFAGELLDKNREALADWDAATKLPDLQVPEVSTAADLLPYLANWKKLAQVAVVRQNFLLHSGQDKEAFDQMVSQIQLGRRMQDAHGVLICYMVGMAINNMGLSQIQHWADRAHLTPSQLKNYIRQLQLDPDDESTALANTFKVEYQCSMGTLDAMRQGKLVDPDTGKYIAHANPMLPIYNRSQTRALFANAFLMLIRSASHPYKDAKFPDLSRPPSPVSLILSGNLAGRVMYYMLLPSEPAVLGKKSQADAQLQATRTILALRAYQLTHGNLPSELSALVPEFLDEVPVDNFDGQPLRYSADRKIVYSVGKNLKDDGGDDRGQEAESSQRHLDLVYKFDF